MGTKPVVRASALAMGFGALLVGTALVAATGASSAAAGVQAEPKAPAKDNSRRICRTLIPSGSRLSSRVCRTQAEWDQSRDRTQQGLLEHQTEQSTGLTPDPNLSPILSPSPNRP